MRITNLMDSTKFLAYLEINKTNLDKYSMQMATGRRMNTIYDDPIGVVKTMTARNQVSTFQRYQKNVNDAKALSDTAESGLQDINNALKNIYELSVRAANDTNNATDRSNIAIEIEQNIERLINIGNTAVGNEYIFGGHNVTKLPFRKDPNTGKVLYNGLDLETAPAADIADEKKQHIKYNVGFGIDMDVSANGVEIFGSGSNSMFAQLNKLVADMRNPNVKNSDINKYLKPLSDMQTSTLQNLVNLGAQTNQIKALESRYSLDVISSEDMRSQIEDADQAEAIMQLKMSEAIYRQTLAAGARILQPSLVDFLK